MKHPWHVWLVFGLSLALVLAAMGWISAIALRSEAAEAAALARSDFEEGVRTCLWRVQSRVNEIVAQEASRPHFAFAPPAGAEAKGTALSAPSPHVLLHFQLTPTGTLVSPEVGEHAAPAPANGGKPWSPPVEQGKKRQVELKRLLSWADMAPRLPQDAPAAGDGNDLVNAPPQLADAGSQLAWNNKDAQAIGNRAQRSAQFQQELNDAEFQARQQSYNRLAQGNFTKGAPSPSDVYVGAMKPVWLHDHLFLARRVVLGKNQYVQGAWLDWPCLRAELLAIVADKFPQADLQPLPDVAEEDPERTVAGLPAVFVPGAAPVAAIETFSPLRTSLGVAWSGVLLAAIAVGALLYGVLRLSERRAAFVSAVTHELRTPLTTFRMYAEMLAGGMVPPPRQHEYLETLRVESDRLSHLVDNVLSYARLERGPPRRRLETVSLSALLAQVEARLRQRAAQAGLQLVTALDAADGAVAARCDASIVEQVLLNLVDNACKYAKGGAPAEIRLELSRRGKHVLLRVRDHGPGIPAGVRQRLFQPFTKSAEDAAHSAPGVGLGLALSRRLARAMGGDLRDEEQPGGASLVLRLRSAET
jgi:signal transduction histidine kinase